MGLFDWLKKGKKDENSGPNLEQVRDIFRESRVGSIVVPKLKAIGYSKWENDPMMAIATSPGGVLALILGRDGQFSSVMYSTPHGQQTSVVKDGAFVR